MLKCRILSFILACLLLQLVDGAKGRKKKTHFSLTELRLVNMRIRAFQKSYLSSLSGMNGQRNRFTDILEKSKLIKKVLAKIPVKTSKGYEEAIRKLREFRKASEYAFLARLDAHIKELVQLLDIQQIGLDDDDDNKNDEESSDSDAEDSGSTSLDSLDTTDDDDSSSSDTWLDSSDVYRDRRSRQRRREPVVLYVPPPLQTRRHEKESSARRKVDPIDRYLERLSAGRHKNGSKRRAGGGLWDNLFGSLK